MAAGITLASAIREFSAELGCGSDKDREDIIRFITKAIEYLLLNGGGDILREWKIPVRNGRFTLPRDVDTPVKYKFAETAAYGFGTFNSPYFSYSSNGIQNCCGYFDWDNYRIALSANRVATQFYPPNHGVRLVATTRDEETVGKKIMVAGKQRGMQVAPKHKGFKTSGELLTIYHEEDPNKKYGAWLFDEITSVVKDETCDYVMLSGIDNTDTFYHLAHYHPDETVPQYTEGHVFDCPCNNQCDYLISILGRVNPSIRYIRDEDILPIDSLEMLGYLAKRARYYENSDFNDVNFMEAQIAKLIKKTVAYQQAPARSLSMNPAASGGSIQNM